MKKDWKRENARDILALGSWIFYLLVIGRSLIKPYRPFADQIIIAGVIIIISGLIFRKFDFDGYVARCLILVVFTSLFYNSFIYTLFAVATGFLLVYSSYFSGNSVKRIIFGFIAAVIGISAGYYLSLIV